MRQSESPVRHAKSHGRIVGPLPRLFKSEGQVVKKPLTDSTSKIYHASIASIKENALHLEPKTV